MPDFASPTNPAVEPVVNISEDKHKLRILLGLSHSLGTEIVLDKLFAVIVAQVTEAMGAERTSLFLYDEASGMLWSKIAQGLDSQEIRIPVGDGLAGTVAKTLTTINIRNAYEDPRFNPSFDKKSGFRTRSILTMPVLNQKNQLLGVVQVLNKRTGPCFNFEDEEFLAAICTHIALSVDRAQLIDAYVRSQRLQESLSWARDIQTGILPKPFGANRPEIEVYATMVPAQDVGGDLYDYCLIDEDHLCFAIGDVSDKGVPAALFMAMARTAFNISVRSGPNSIAEVLRTVNNFLVDNNDSQMFVTMFAGILNLKSGVISYSDGGHEDPFIIRLGNTVEQFHKVSGLALGVTHNYEFSCGAMQLNPGDALVLYTDGVNEAMNKSRKMFSTERIGQTLLPHLAGSPARTLATAIVANVVEFAAGAPQSDDITVMTIRYLGPKPASV
jgi:sigma-B regulation protein RsbU (phosphoserine phosphatase)